MVKHKIALKAYFWLKKCKWLFCTTQSHPAVSCVKIKTFWRVMNSQKEIGIRLKVLKIISQYPVLIIQINFQGGFMVDYEFLANNHHFWYFKTKHKLLRRFNVSQWAFSFSALKMLLRVTGCNWVAQKSNLHFFHSPK